jgi:hypothetical protein
MAGDNAVVHRALDGTTFKVHAVQAPLDFSRPFTSIAEAVVGGRLFEFTAGVPALAGDLLEAFGARSFDEELHYRGGTLRLATRRTYDPRNHLVESPTLVTWQGEQHSLVTHVYGMDTASILAALRPVGIDETGDGIALALGEGAHFALPAFVVKEVPGLGLLEISAPGKRSLTRRPSGQSVVLPSGELFWDKLTNGNPYAILVGDGVHTTVLPLSGSDLKRLPNLVGGLQISATVPAGRDLAA